MTALTAQAGSYDDVHAGFVRVGDAPGLGVELDRAKLAALTEARPFPDNPSAPLPLTALVAVCAHSQY